MQMRLTFCLLIASALLCAAARAAEDAPAPSVRDRDAAALLAQTRAELDRGETARAVASAGRLLTLARERKDRVAEAWATQLRALGDDRLVVPIEQRVRNWQETVAAWDRAGNGEAAVEAILNGAANTLHTPAEPVETNRFLAMVPPRIGAETRRPRAVLGTLRRYRTSFPNSGQLLDIARAAAKVTERLDPGSDVLANDLLWLGRLEFAFAQLQRGEAYLLRGLAITESRLQDSPTALRILLALWNNHAARGNPEETARYRERWCGWLERLLAAGKPPEGLRPALDEGMSEALGRGDYPGIYALAVWRVRHRESTAPRTPDMIHVLSEAGHYGFMAQDPVGALDYHHRSIKLAEELVGRPDQRAGVASVLHLLKGSANRLEEVPGARDLWDRLLAVCRTAAPDSPVTADVLSGLGRTWVVRGDLNKAGVYAAEALALAERVAPDSHAVLESLLVLVGQRLAQAGILAIPTLMSGRRYSGRPEELAAAAAFLDRFDAAKEKQPADLTFKALGLGLRGLVIYHQSDRKEDLLRARTALSEGLTALRASGRSQAVGAAFLISLEHVARGLGDAAAAEQYRAEMGRLLLTEQLDLRRLDAAIGISALGASLLSTTLEEEEQKLRQSWATVLQQAESVPSDEERQGYIHQFVALSAKLAEAQVRLRKLPAAFRTLEEGRALGLRQLLADRRADPDGADAALRGTYQEATAAVKRAQQERDIALQAEEAARQQMLSAREPTAPAAGRAEAEARVDRAHQHSSSREQAYQSARARAEEILFRLRRSRSRGEAEVSDVEQARRALRPGELYVTWVLGEKRDYVLLARGEGGQGPGRHGGLPLQAYELTEGCRPLLADLMKKARTALTTQGRDALPVLHRLYEHLFPPPVRAALAQARRIVVAPDGPLWNLSFAALVTVPGSAPRFLGLEKAILYAPSLSVFVQMRRESPPGAAEAGQKAKSGAPARSTLIVGDPLVTGTGAGGVPRGPADPALPPGSFPPLPNAAAEAVQVGRVYGVTPLLGAAATEPAVRALLERAEIIHLAAHGVLQSNAMSSGILLASPSARPTRPGAAGTRGGGSGPAGPAGNPATRGADPAPRALAGDRNNSDMDGFLQAWEIQSQFRLRARLVVLSACESAGGAELAGEANIGLTRALQAAGARTVVASQWKVEDAATKSLMVALHRGLSKQVACDEALRQGMQAVAKNPDWSHPYFWAAFTCLGDSGAAAAPPESRPRTRVGVGGPAPRTTWRGTARR